MEYNKKIWVSKELITKEALNNIEDGIDNLYTKVEELASVEHDHNDIYYTKEEIDEKKLISYYDIYLQDENGDYIIDEDGNYIIENYASVSSVEKLQNQIDDLMNEIDELKRIVENLSNNITLDTLNQRLDNLTIDVVTEEEYNALEQEAKNTLYLIDLNNENE